MTIVLVLVHVIVCIALIMIVLLQTGKGADMGAAFGGGASQTLFGSSGASTFLSKATTIAAIIFMVTSLFLAYFSGHKTGSSVLSDTKPPAEESRTADEKTKAETSEPVKTEAASVTEKTVTIPVKTEAVPVTENTAAVPVKAEAVPVTENTAAEPVKTETVPVTENIPAEPVKTEISPAPAAEPSPVVTEPPASSQPVPTTGQNN
jgi:preprotein translocase subunit SecG